MPESTSLVNLVNKQIDIEQIELELLIEAINKLYGYDFSLYSSGSLKHSLQHMIKAYNICCISEIIPLILHNSKFFDDLLRALSVGVTEMFRDPGFFISFRNHVMPTLKTFPYVKIWHAGCSTGEEVYSMAILLKEQSFLDKAIIYGTDFNREALNTASDGIYPLNKLPAYEENYTAAGSKYSLSDYYHKQYGFAKFENTLKKGVTFSYHNLVSDGVFGEMNVIYCRNVLIYFNNDLQNRVIQLFTDSLRYGGFLCIGRYESLYSTPYQHIYELVDREQSIYRKIIPKGRDSW